MSAGDLRRFGALLDVGPEVEQEAEVGAELFFAGARGGGADDEAAGGFALFAERRISFRRRRSPSDSILRETPVWLTVGMKTRKRPGSAMCEVMRAPFLAMGSLAIWTRISWPGFSRSLMAGRLVDCMEWRDRRAAGRCRRRRGRRSPPAWRSRLLRSPSLAAADGVRHGGHRGGRGATGRVACDRGRALRSAAAGLGLVEAVGRRGFAVLVGDSVRRSRPLRLSDSSRSLRRLRRSSRLGRRRRGLLLRCRSRLLPSSSSRRRRAG